MRAGNEKGGGDELIDISATLAIGYLLTAIGFFGIGFVAGIFYERSRKAGSK